MHVAAAYVTELVGANKIQKKNRQLGGRDVYSGGWRNLVQI